jgi:methylated-DNA-[protein]-cysteine S-methyltransferase
MRLQILSLERLQTPTGPILIVTDDEHRVRAVEWEDHEHRMRRLLRRYYGENAILLREASHHSAAWYALGAYFDGDMNALAGLTTATNGTDFQRTVWAALRRIPVGCTMSYGFLAAEIGRPRAIRAVGLANGANLIPIVLPCHRVIGTDASLTGFGSGLDRKRWLLAHERTSVASGSQSQTEIRLRVSTRCPHR